MSAEIEHPDEQLQSRAHQGVDIVHDALLTWASELRQRIAPPPFPALCGRLQRVVGLTMEAVGLREEVGSWCQIIGRDGRHVDAEVIGFSEGRTFLMAGDHAPALRPGAAVRPMGRPFSIRASDAWLGRVVDGWGQPADHRGPLLHDEQDTSIALETTHYSPLDRLPPAGALDVGVRAINGLLTIARGQRMAILAGTGVGKSVLLGMMARYTAADRVVVAGQHLGLPPLGIAIVFESGPRRCHFGAGAHNPMLPKWFLAILVETWAGRNQVAGTGPQRGSWSVRMRRAPSKCLAQ